MNLPFGELESLLRLQNNFPDYQSLVWPNPAPSPASFYPRQITYDDTESEDWYDGGKLLSIEEVESLMQQPSMNAIATQNALDIGRISSSVSTALKSVVPKLIADEKLLPSSRFLASNDPVFKSPLHRQILFSVANNFAGLSAFPVGDIMLVLQRETTEKLYQMVRSARGPASRAIIQNIFKAAIEIGDARIVDLLVRENTADIRVNEQFLVAGGFRYTPIERATALRHEAVVRNLVCHGADVNNTDPRKDNHSGSINLYGALDHAVCTIRNNVLHLDIHYQLCLVLLQAGGDLSYGPMEFLIEAEQGEFVELILSKKAQEKAAKWYPNEISTTYLVIKCLDSERALRIVEMMLKLGVDPNIQHDASGIDKTRNIIDAAAQRGNLRLVSHLLDSGARLTEDTLPAAVTSGNKDLIMLLISRGAEVNCIGELRITPLAAAIRLQSSEIIKMLENHGASPLSGEKNFSAAFQAASEVGNIQLIESLVELRGNVSPNALGYALTVALRDGRDEIVQTLIDAGADVNVNADVEYDPCLWRVPLFYALERRNESLVFSLIDADADLNYGYSSTGTIPALQLATEWGNRSVIEALIFAGAKLDTKNQHSRGALTIAVKQRNLELVQLLLASGADVNNRIYDGTALEAAAENSDIEMTRYLLDHGADPNDSWAFKAAYRDPNLFELIFERCCARYPISQCKLGTTLLVQLVQEGSESSVRQILRMGVDANAAIIDVRHGNTTPFGYAIALQQDNKNNFLEMFLQKGCNPNSVVFRAGRFSREHPLLITAFLAAIDTQILSTVELFIRYGADVNFPTRLRVKRTPLQRAAELGNLDIVDMLVNRGADVNASAAASRGGTALQLAAAGCHVSVACRLLSLGADVNTPGSTINGKTALEAAAEQGRLDMVQILFNAGAGSKGSDKGQITNAIALANGNGHFGVCELLERHLHPEAQGSRLETLDEGIGEDFTGSSLNSDPLSLHARAGPMDETS